MDKLNLGQHISKQFNEQLEEVRSKVLQMGGIVEEQAGNAVRALVDGADRQQFFTITKAECESVVKPNSMAKCCLFASNIAPRETHASCVKNLHGCGRSSEHLR